MTHRFWTAFFLALMAGIAQAATPQIDVLLAAHNSWRAELALPPLVWSDDLAKSAQAWADELAGNDSFKHSTSNHGENIWKGTAAAYSQQSMVNSWGEEKKFYVHGIFPAVTTGGVVGHYTQIVWRTTRQVGCGLGTAHGYDVLVCQYDPPGNWTGQQPY